MDGVILVGFEVGVVRGFESVRSAHIQLFYKFAEVIQASGIKLTVATNKLRPNTVLDQLLSGTEVITLADPRKRKKTNVMESGFSTRINLLGGVRALFQLYRLAKNRPNEVIHFVNGSVGVGVFAGLLKVLGVSNRIVWTPSFPFSQPASTVLSILRRIDKIVCSTEFLRDHLVRFDLEATTVKHGVFRELKLKDKSKFRVTFWRDPSYENGADIALSVFETLSKVYPAIQFTMLLRPHWAPLVQ